MQYVEFLMYNTSNAFHRKVRRIEHPTLTNIENKTSKISKLLRLVTLIIQRKLIVLTKRPTLFDVMYIKKFDVPFIRHYNIRCNVSLPTHTSKWIRCNVFSVIRVYEMKDFEIRTSPSGCQRLETGSSYRQPDVNNKNDQVAATTDFYSL